MDMHNYFEKDYQMFFNFEDENLKDFNAITIAMLEKVYAEFIETNKIQHANKHAICIIAEEVLSADDTITKPIESEGVKFTPIDSTILKDGDSLLRITCFKINHKIETKSQLKEIDSAILKLAESSVGLVAFRMGFIQHNIKRLKGMGVRKEETKKLIKVSKMSEEIQTKYRKLRMKIEYAKRIIDLEPDGVKIALENLHNFEKELGLI